MTTRKAFHYKTKPYNVKDASSAVSLPPSFQTGSSKRPSRASRQVTPSKVPLSTSSSQNASTRCRNQSDAYSVVSAPYSYPEVIPKQKKQPNPPRQNVIPLVDPHTQKETRQEEPNTFNVQHQQAHQQAQPQNPPLQQEQQQETRQLPDDHLGIHNLPTPIGSSSSMIPLLSNEEVTATSVTANDPIAPPASRYIHASIYSQSTIPGFSSRRRRKYFNKWGIPLPKDIPNMDNTKPLEVVLQERLVWIRYKERYWWPAILYDNYRQIAEDRALSKQVWFRLPLLQRVSLAKLLAFDKSNPRNQMLVARILGKPGVELVEIDEYWAFDTKVAVAISEMACQGDYFFRHPMLYLEWHAAMDQVETIVTDCLGSDLVLKQVPPGEQSGNSSTASSTSTMTANTIDKMNPLAEHSHFADGDTITVENTIVVPINGKHKSWVERAKQAERIQWASTCQEWHAMLDCGCGGGLVGGDKVTEASRRKLSKLPVY